MQACLNLISQADVPQCEKTVDFPDSICHAFSCAIQEALNYVGKTSPNPPVGCAVLNQSGELLTVAAHHQAGEKHAEVLALQQCRDLGVWDQIFDIVVTFEPCNHVGRTPPCSEALLQTPAKRIWVGTSDPNPNVQGAGNQRLRQGGKQVILLSDLDSDHARYWTQRCQELVAPFIKTVTRRQAWITVKQALTVMSSMIPPAGQKTFTSQSSLRLAHQLRRGVDAIITGPNTIRSDWPSFTVRHVPDHSDKERLLVICSQQKKRMQDIIPTQFLEETRRNGFCPVLCQDIEQLPFLLYEHQAIWGMVEGGPRLVQYIQQKQIWDEWLVFRQHVEGRDKMNLSLNHHRFSPARLLLSTSQPFKPLEFQWTEKEKNACSLVL